MHILIPIKLNEWKEESKSKEIYVMHYIDISFLPARPTRVWGKHCPVVNKLQNVLI